MLIRRVLGASTVVASAVLFSACAPGISSERDANIPVPQGATWTWAGAAAAPSRDTAAPPRGRYIPRRYTYATVDPIVRQRFVRAMDAAMRAKGFHKLDDTAQADFLLSFSFETQPAYARARGVTPAAGFGWGGWGYRPWGFYRPWGWGWMPWGWGWGFGFAAVPAYGYDAEPAYYGGRGYREGWLVVQLRLRSDGETAWIGRSRTSPGEARRMTDAKLQDVVNRLFSTLR